MSESSRTIRFRRTPEEMKEKLQYNHRMSRALLKALAHIAIDEEIARDVLVENILQDWVDRRNARADEE